MAYCHIFVQHSIAVWHAFDRCVHNMWMPQYAQVSLHNTHTHTHICTHSLYKNVIVNTVQTSFCDLVQGYI